jgi:hypothetical protein
MDTLVAAAEAELNQLLSVNTAPSSNNANQGGQSKSSSQSGKSGQSTGSDN